MRIAIYLFAVIVCGIVFTTCCKAQCVSGRCGTAIATEYIYDHDVRVPFPITLQSSYRTTVVVPQPVPQRIWNRQPLVRRWIAWPRVMNTRRGWGKY